MGYIHPNQGGFRAKLFRQQCSDVLRTTGGIVCHSPLRVQGTLGLFQSPYSPSGGFLRHLISFLWHNYVVCSSILPLSPSQSPCGACIFRYGCVTVLAKVVLYPLTPLEQFLVLPKLWPFKTVFRRVVQCITF